MKVLALNSSSNTCNSNIALTLDPFLKGMRESGAEVSLFNLKDFNIDLCQSDYRCKFCIPGEGIGKGDVQRFYLKLNSDIYVFATPADTDEMIEVMKNLTESMQSSSSTTEKPLDDHSLHPIREKSKTRGLVVLISSCDLWELDTFNSLLFQAKAISRSLNREFAGALLRPHAAIFRGMLLSMTAPVEDILEAAEEAGRQLIRSGKISAKTLDTISRPLVSLEDYRYSLNKSIKGMPEAAVRL